MINFVSNEFLIAVLLKVIKILEVVKKGTVQAIFFETHEPDRLFINTEIFLLTKVLCPDKKKIADKRTRNHTIHGNVNLFIDILF